MFAEERWLRIVELVNQTGKATVVGLSEKLGVSSVTIRRDLEKLETNRLLKRTHGGALPIRSQDVQVEKSFYEKQEKLTSEKERIAEAAVSLIDDHDAILLTPGTTNMLLARKLSGKKGVTLVTNAANIAASVDGDSELDVVLLGGKMRKKSFALVGPIAEAALRHIRVDKLFLGVDGFDLQAGLTTPNLSEASINRQMILIAKQVIVVADHTKFGQVMFSHIAPATAAHTVISDSMLCSSLCEAIRGQGIQLLVV